MRRDPATEFRMIAIHYIVISRLDALPMNQTVLPSQIDNPAPCGGVVALCAIAAIYRLAAEPAHLAKAIAIDDGETND